MMATKLPATFTPVSLRPRHDGWTADKQIAFIEKLAECGSVTAAARHVGMSRESARLLRQRWSGRAFRDAWDAALDCNYAEVEEAAMERSKNGVSRPVFYKGEQVGEWRYFDERLTMFLLRFRRRHRFGAGADVPTYPPPIVYGPDEQIPFDPEAELDGCFEGGDFKDEPSPGDDDDASSAANGEEE
jgi:hypothetical protein